MKKNVSGSIENTPDYKKEDLEKESIELLKKFFDSDIFGSVLEGEITKEKYILKAPKDGSRYHWFFNIDTKQLQRFHKDIFVEIISVHSDNKYICYANGFNYIIPQNLIKEESVN